eukprot:TRINITY_DN57_c0_g1_i1.p1 TRINITY_DN57_c0_g1~~TRINITY_DN57_c0_g1_i1.p1  ORF type:complete len:138 (+),score=20.35 TRINITY_DN57_c0_g1_i1:258-671(+)
MASCVTLSIAAASSSSALAGCLQKESKCLAARECLSGAFPVDQLRARTQVAISQNRTGSVKIVAGNKNEGKGIFAPIVVLVRNVVGQKRFNQLRGKGIAIHSQVITEFCKSIGADAKQRQGLIRLAKKNGEKLGFLA